MTGDFDDLVPATQEPAVSDDFADLIPAKVARPAASIRRTGGEVVDDSALVLRQGTRDVAGGVVGLPADLVNLITMLPRQATRAGNALREGIGFPDLRPEIFKDVPGITRALPQPAAVRGIRESLSATNAADAAQYQSEKAAAQEQELGAIDGFLPSLAYLIKNPSAAALQGVRQVPQLLQAVPGSLVGTIGAQAAGAGAQNERQTVEAMREAGASEEEIAEAGANVFAASAGLNAALPAIPGAQVIERVIANRAAKEAGGSLVGAIAKGVAAEGAQGVLSESGDQAISNVASGRPVGEGVGSAAALGLLLDGPAGGAAGALEHLSAPRGTSRETNGPAPPPELAAAITAQLQAQAGEPAPGAGVAPITPAPAAVDPSQAPADLVSAIAAGQLPPELAPRQPPAPELPPGTQRETLVQAWQNAGTDQERARAASAIAAFDVGNPPAQAPAPASAPEPAVVLAKPDDVAAARAETVAPDPDGAFRRPAAQEPAQAPPAPEPAATVPERAPAAAAGRPASELAASTRREIGWEERGGKMIRGGQIDPSETGPDAGRTQGDVIGRTPWVARVAPDGTESQLWRMRPDKALTEKQAGIALEKYERGEKLAPIEQRFIDHAEKVQRGYEEAEAEIQTEVADFEEGERVRALRALRDDHGIDITEGERAEALGLVQLVQRAVDAGLDEIDLAQASNESDKAYAGRLWSAIRESGNGSSEAQGDSAGRIEGQEGGQARTEQQRALFAEPTAREQAEGLRRQRDDERNGKGADRETPAFSSTDLGAGARPEQGDVEGGQVEASRDMFVPTRGDRTPVPIDTPQPASAIPAEIDPPDATRPKWAGKDPVRPDFDASLTRRAANDIDALLEKFGGSVIADQMVRNFRATQSSQLVGKVVKSADDFAAIAQVYRNPLFETMHYVYVDGDGNVLKETAVSSRMPSSSSAFPDGHQDNGPQWVRDQAPAGATGVWFMHNHPSGNPTPSRADLSMTQAMVNLMRLTPIKVMGHVIINHKRFGVIDNTRSVQWAIGNLDKPGDRSAEFEPAEFDWETMEGDPMIQDRGALLLGQKITGPQGAASVAKLLAKYNPQNSAAFFMTNASGKVKTAASIPYAALQSKRGAGLLSTLIDRSGGDNAFLVVRASALRSEESQKMLRQAVSSALIRDVVITDDDGVPDWDLHEAMRFERKGLDTEARSKSRRRRLERGGQRVFDSATDEDSQAELDEILLEHGIAIDSAVDASKRYSDGQLVFAIHEQSGDASEVTSMEMLRSYAPDQLIALPRELAESLGVRSDSRAAGKIDQTKTPAFKAWFGDSKVVDAKGDPLVVYRGEHGQDTSADFSSRMGSVTFTDDPGVASTYAMTPNNRADYAEAPRVSAAYLRITNPVIDNRDDPFLEMGDLLNKLGRDEAVRIARKFSDDIEDTGNWQEDLSQEFASVDAMMDAAPQRVIDLYFDAYKFFDDAHEVSKLKAAGFDGAVHVGNGESMDALEFRVFGSDQVKSATGNSGAFDPGNPSIVQSPKTPYQAHAQRAQTFGKLAALGYNQGAVTQPVPGGRFEPLQRAADALRTKLQDKMLPLLRAQERTGATNAKALTSVTMDDSMNAYRMENLMHGRARDQLDRANEELILPAQRMMKNLGVTPDMVQDVMLATHAPERNAKVAALHAKGGQGNLLGQTPAMQDGAAGITTAEAGEILAGTREGPYSGKKLTPAQIRDARLVWDKFRMLRERTIDNMVEAGQISRKDAAALRAAYKHYVPLRGKDSPFAGEGAAGTGRGITVRKSPIKRALGRGKGNLAKNIMGEIVGDYQRSIAVKEKARVARGFLKFALDNPQPDLYKVEPVDLEWKYNELTGEAYLGVKNSAEDATTSIIVRHDGEPVRIRFEDPALRDAMMNMGVDDLSSFVKIIGSVNRWRSKVLTQYNPAFTPVNVLRDLQFGMTALVSERGFKGAARAAIDYLPAMRAAWRDAGAVRRGDPTKPNAQKNTDDWMAEAAQAGMKTGLTQVDDVQDLQRRLSIGGTSLMRLAAEGRATRLATESVIRPLRALAEVIERVNDATENALRLAAYIQDRKNGASVAKAAEYAKNLTINFNRKGQLGPALNALYLFYNASIQGTHAVQRVLRNPKTLAYLGGLAVLQSILADSLMDEDDEGDGVTVWDEIPAYVKRTSFIVPLGALTGNNRDYFALPMPFGFNVFPYSGGRLMQRYRMGARDTDTNVVTDIIKAQIEAFSPVPVAEGYHSLFGDTIGFMLNLASNTDDFGAPIAQDDQFSKYDEPKALQGKTDTPRIYQATAQLLAKIGGAKLDKRIPPVGYLDIAPEQIEAVTNYMGGGLMAMANKSQRWYEQMNAGNLNSAMEVIAATPIASRLVNTAKQDRAIAERYYGERGELARKMDVLQDELRKVVPDKKPVKDEYGKKTTPEGRRIDELAKDEFAYQGLNPATRKKAGKRKDQKPGTVMRTATDGVEIATEGESVYSTLKNTEKGNKAANAAIRQLRSTDLTNADAVAIIRSFGPDESISRYKPADLDLPDNFDPKATTPARIRTRAIKLVQQARMVNQRTLLKILRMSRTQFEVGKQIEDERGNQN